MILFPFNSSSFSLRVKSETRYKIVKLKLDSTNMFKRSKNSSIQAFNEAPLNEDSKSEKNGTTSSSTSISSSNNTSTTAFLESLSDPNVVERVRTTIKNAHVFKLPTRQSGSIGWRGADWKDKVWHGTCKVVDRGNVTAVILVDSQKGTIFAVCPIREGAVERCVDSSRYFVLRIENQNGRHMFIGVAFNERNDAFDFNTSLQDAQREREYESNGGSAFAALEASMSVVASSKDYSLKEGVKITVKVPKKNRSMTNSGEGGTAAFASFTELQEEDSPEKQRTPTLTAVKSKSSKFMLKPSSKDTPTRSQVS